MMRIQELFDTLINRKYLAHALAIHTQGVNMQADLQKEFLDNINEKVANMAIALDEWRCENESQFDEDDKDFNNWVGDTLEIQEECQNNKITFDDLKSWGLF